MLLEVTDHGAGSLVGWGGGRPGGESGMYSIHNVLLLTNGSSMQFWLHSEEFPRPQIGE